MTKEVVTEPGRGIGKCEAQCGRGQQKARVVGAELVQVQGREQVRGWRRRLVRTQGPWWSRKDCDVPGTWASSQHGGHRAGPRNLVALSARPGKSHSIESATLGRRTSHKSPLKRRGPRLQLRMAGTRGSHWKEHVRRARSLGHLRTTLYTTAGLRSVKGGHWGIVQESE